MSDVPIEGSAEELPSEVAEPVSPGRELDRPVQSGSVNLFGAATPTQVVSAATEVANALKGVLQRQGMLQRIQGREHVKVEGWQTTGAMLGLAARVDWSRPVLDPASGEMIAHDYEVVEVNRKTSVERRFRVTGHDWEAHVSIVKGDGTVIASGEAMCSRAESTWAQRDDYALRSMAQTRATSKAFKGVLGFIVTMAGYESTPSDEMPGGDATQVNPMGTAASDALSDTLNAALHWAADNRLIAPTDPMRVRMALMERAGGYLPASGAQGVLLLVKAAKDLIEADLEQQAADHEEDRSDVRSSDADGGAGGGDGGADADDRADDGEPDAGDPAASGA